LYNQFRLNSTRTECPKYPAATLISVNVWFLRIEVLLFKRFKELPLIGGLPFRLHYDKIIASCRTKKRWRLGVVWIHWI